ncbi:MAG: hypothetical protein ACFB2W_00660 [Leptolyngbyaceae cyanobacterium]
MTLTARATQWQISINVLDADKDVLSGPHALDSSLFAIQVDFSEINLEGPNGYLAWAGSLTLLDIDALTLSIDSRDTAATPTGASLLAQGNAVDLRLFTGGSYQRFWPTFYILSEQQVLDQPRENTAVYQVGDITQLDTNDIITTDPATGRRRRIKGITPEGNLSGMTLGTSTTRSTIANNILTARRLPSSTDVISEYPLSVPPQKLGTNDWPSEIGRLVGTTGYYFWMDRDDNARFTRINLDKSAPDFTLTIGQDEEDWQRVNISERPPAKLIVTGSGGRAIQRDNPEVITTVGPEKETTLTRTISTAFNRVTEVYEERLSERTILPRIPTQGTVDGIATIDDYTENTSTALRLAKRETTTREYSNNGELQVHQVIIEVAKGMAGGDAFRDTDTVSDAYDLLIVEDTTVTYDYRDGRVSDRTIRTKRPWAVIPWANVRPSNYEANRFLTQTNLTKTEGWRKRLFGGGQWKHEFETRRPQGELSTYYGPDINADVLREDPAETDAIESNEDGPAAPPATEFMPLLFEQDDRVYSGSVEITPLSGQAYKNRERTVAIQGSYVVSNAQCSFLAQIVGRLEHGLSLGQQFSGEIPQWLIDSFEPGARVDITDNGITKSYLLNGFTITADSTETLWGCTLAELGTVGVTPDVVVPPISIAYPLTVSSSVPMPGVSASVTSTETTEIATPVPMPGVSVVVQSPISIAASTPVPMPGISITALESGIAAVSTPIPMPGASISVAPEGAIVAATPVPMPGVSISVAEAGGTDPDADAFIARTNGTYSAPELAAIDAFFVRLKADSLYSKIAGLWVYALDTSNDALLNWVSTNYTSTQTNMTFTAREGFTGNGSSSFINSNYVPSTQTNTGQTNIAVHFYTRSRSAGGFNDFGGRSGFGAPLNSIRVNTAGETSFATLNNATSPAAGIVSSGLTGLHTISRIDNSDQIAYRNGAVEGTLSQNTNGQPTVTMYFAGFNAGGAVSASSDGQYAMGAITEGMTGAEVSDFNTRVTTLLTAFNATV